MLLTKESERKMLTFRKKRFQKMVEIGRS